MRKLFKLRLSSVTFPFFANSDGVRYIYIFTEMTKNVCIYIYLNTCKYIVIPMGNLV